MFSPAKFRSDIKTSKKLHSYFFRKTSSWKTKRAQLIRFDVEKITADDIYKVQPRRNRSLKSLALNILKYLPEDILREEPDFSSIKSNDTIQDCEACQNFSQSVSSLPSVDLPNNGPSSDNNNGLGIYSDATNVIQPVFNPPMAQYNTINDNPPQFVSHSGPSNVHGNNGLTYSNAINVTQPVLNLPMATDNSPRFISINSPINGLPSDIHSNNNGHDIYPGQFVPYDSYTTPMTQYNNNTTDPSSFLPSHSEIFSFIVPGSQVVVIPISSSNFNNLHG